MASNVLNTLQKRSAPTMAQSNNQFISGNPQFGSPTSPYGSAPVAPVGQRATSPQDNLIPPKNTIPPSQVATPDPKGPAGAGTSNTAAVGNTGLVGGASSLDSGGNPAYGAAANGLLNIGQNESPEVTNARNELQRYQNSYANANAGVGLAGTDFSYAQGTEQNIANQYQQGLASRQQGLQNALTAQSSKISALGGAGSLASPRQNGYALLNPFNNSPVGGGGGSGNLNGLVTWGAGLDSLGGRAKQQADNVPLISSGKALGDNVVALMKNSGLNQNDLAIANWVGNRISANLSDPRLAPIQSAFNNALIMYAKVLGTDPNTLASNLVSQSQGQSVDQFFQNLNNQATSYNNALLSGQAAPIPVQPQAQNGSSVNEGDTHTTKDANGNTVTYKAINGHWVQQ